MDNFLPEKFQEIHEYCFFLHDQLVETLRSGEEANIFETKVRFKESNHSQEIEGKSGEDLIDWFRAKGYERDVRIIFYKEIFRALLSDYLHFIHEALECSRKGKLTITYALLRKPMKENLFYLEWLLANPRDFFDKYESRDPKQLSISRISEKDRIETIKTALEKTSLGVWIEPSFIHDIRYSKSSELSFENYFQKANHLITTFRFLETEPENFNFIFSGLSNKLSQWEGLYAILPFILFHSVQVIESLLRRMARRAVDGHDFVEVKTHIGLIKWLIEGFWEFEADEIPMPIILFLKEYDLPCKLCNSRINILRSDLDRLYLQGECVCPCCKSVVSFV
ncbi:MAG: hypothetical protein ACHWZW_05185 [Spirulina sp.]